MPARSHVAVGAFVATAGGVTALALTTARDQPDARLASIILTILTVAGILWIAGDRRHREMKRLCWRIATLEQQQLTVLKRRGRRPDPETSGAHRAPWN